ncbi:MAG: S1 RNA-binding domain-containing protein [Anaerolineae bacterium]|nr:S1 RNA-binding domain-containing protein [Anaerolineae bacterium]
MDSSTSFFDSDRNPMGSLLDEYLEEHRWHHGDIVDGVIASVTPRSILIDVGGKADAVVHPKEVERMSSQDIDELRPGQDVSVFVIDADNDGSMTVSLARAAQQTDWEDARQLMDNNEMVELLVVDTNKGGVIVRLGQLRGFVPGSQLMPNWRRHQQGGPPEARWRGLMGEKLKLMVIEVTPERNRLIFSERNAYHRRDTKRDILEKLDVGSTHKGVVNNIVPFGAFVNVNGVDGLLHVSELSWKRVNDPHEIVQVGQTIEVYVLDVDLDKERLGLSLKRLVPDPWTKVDEVCTVGDLVDVTIVNLTPFGAFAAIAERPEIEGLIHISELSYDTIGHPEEIVEIGQRCTVKVISVKPDQRRIAFSLKVTDEEEPPIE